MFINLWLPVIELILEKEPSANPRDIFAVCGSDKGFLDRHPHSVRNLNVIHDIILHEGALSSTVRHLSYYWDKEERKKIKSIM